jgi:glyoxylase-like metal-dependent hydrolase (beta-lactamase superfamily II)
MRGPIDHVYLYILETAAGLVLVDAGPTSGATARALVRALRALGSSPSDIAAVLVTHGHPDHYGLAASIASRASAVVLLHDDDGDLALAGLTDAGAVRDREAAWHVHAGVPAAECAPLSDASVSWHEAAPRTAASGRLADGDVVAFGERRLEVVHTPGHTAGHVALIEPERGLAFLGDHVLPRISPNIALFAGDRRNALGDYLRSLRRLPTQERLLGLPGHEGPVTDLSGRVEELLAHHEQRLDETEAALGRRGSTAWDVAAGARWARPWHTIRGLTRSAAVGEVFAHLVELEARGRVVSRLHATCATEWVPSC